MKVLVRKKYKWLKIAAGVVIFILLIFLLNFFKEPIRGFFYSFSAPIQKTFWAAGKKTSDFLASLAKTGQLKNEVDNLKKQNQDLLYQIASLTELKKENEALKEALDIGLSQEFKILPAEIIGKDISQDFILIDKGKRDGVFKNMPLITPQKVIVGKVVEIYENQAKVMLISNKNSSFDAKISGKDIAAVVKGEGNFKIVFDLVPHESDIQNGDIILTTKAGGIFPDGLLAGKVKEIKKSDLEAFQKAELEPFFDITRDNILFLIKGF